MMAAIVDAMAWLVRSLAVALGRVCVCVCVCVCGLPLAECCLCTFVVPRFKKNNNTSVAILAQAILAQV